MEPVTGTEGDPLTDNWTVRGGGSVERIDHGHICGRLHRLSACLGGGPHVGSLGPHATTLKDPFGADRYPKRGSASASGQ